jgi:type IV pilus assembly protein PilF
MCRKNLFYAILFFYILILIPSCAGISQKKEKQNKSADAYYQLGIQHLTEGDYQNALLELRRAESLKPEDPVIHDAKGIVYYYMERFDEAEKEYKKAVSLQKDYSKSYVNLGTLYARQKKYPEAIEQYRKALENPFYETPAKALHNIGLCYEKTGNIKEAESSLLEAVQQDPNLMRAYLDLGRVYYQDNETEKAIRILSKAIQQHPRVENDPVNDLSLAYFHYWLALSYFKNSDSENALIHFQEVTRLAPNSKLTEDALSYLDLLQ